MPVKEPGNAICLHAKPHAGDAVFWGCLGISHQEVGPVAGEATHMAAGIATGQGLHPQTSILECFVNDFEQQSLLRVHRSGVPRRDIEEGRVKQTDIFTQEMGAVGQDGANLVRWVAVCIDVEPIGRYLGVAACPDEV